MVLKWVPGFLNPLKTLLSFRAWSTAPQQSSHVFHIYLILGSICLLEE